MAPLPLISLGLKAFTAFWSLLTWVVAAAFVGQLNSYGECFAYHRRKRCCAEAAL